jgi:hypothetical protein
MERELERILLLPATDERADKELESLHPRLFEHHPEVLNLIEAILEKEYPAL